MLVFAILTALALTMITALLTDWPKFLHKSTNVPLSFK